MTGIPDRSVPFRWSQGFEALLLGKDDAKAAVHEEREKQRAADGLGAVTEVMTAGVPFWLALSSFARAKRVTTPEDEAALTIACSMPRRVPADWQAARLLAVRERCEEAGSPSEQTRHADRLC